MREGSGSIERKPALTLAFVSCASARSSRAVKGLRASLLVLLVGGRGEAAAFVFDDGGSPRRRRNRRQRKRFLIIRLRGVVLGNRWRVGSGAVKDAASVGEGEDRG